MIRWNKMEKSRHFCFQIRVIWFTLYCHKYFWPNKYCVLQDEYQTTTKSYEGQLSMMSDHLAGMNEKITKQKDEIDELKSQAASSKVTNEGFMIFFILIQDERNQQ